MNQDEYDNLRKRFTRQLRYGGHVSPGEMAILFDALDERTAKDDTTFAKAFDYMDYLDQKQRTLDIAPELFILWRSKDESGVSGTGIVADGIQFSDGTVVIHWRGEHPSVVVWKNLDDAMAIHGHKGLTQVIWAKG